MNGPKASIDRCSNCIYWERISAQRGLCHIISYPEKFHNDLATIEILAREAGKLRTAPESKVLTGADSRYTVAFMPTPGFHCTLYKVGREQ